MAATSSLAKERPGTTQTDEQQAQRAIIEAEPLLHFLNGAILALQIILDEDEDGLEPATAFALKSARLAFNDPEERLLPGGGFPWKPKN